MEQVRIDSDTGCEVKVKGELSPGEEVFGSNAFGRREI